jgi:hypothetical protein
LTAEGFEIGVIADLGFYWWWETQCEGHGFCFGILDSLSFFLLLAGFFLLVAFFALGIPS